MVSRAFRFFSFFAATFIFLLVQSATVIADGPALVFQPNDHVAVIGNTTADRMQHHGWLETYIHATHPKLNLTFRNLGFSGDEVKTRPRSDNFGDADQWLAKCKADVVFGFFGYNEALRGNEGIDGFRNELSAMIDHMLSRKYNGKSAPRLVLFSPIAHENLGSPHLPSGAENNAKISKYTGVMRDVCAEKDIAFVDLFAPSIEFYQQSDQPLTMNGIHLLDRGNRAIAGVIMEKLFHDAKIPTDVSKLREAVLDKNYHWFSRYRVVDEYNVFGGRSRLNWHGQSNADVMGREMQILDVMTENRDKRIWAIARSGDLVVRDNNLPQQEIVKTNKPGPNPDGSWPYLGGEEAISKMTIAEGMEVNLFASEEEFPRLVNPVQMAVDTDSRLWASVWPSYPHWNPTEPRRDALLIFPDENGDGKADDCIVFADELNSITGFEFWNGGVLVAAPPEIWFLKDTDGDDKADQKLRVLQGVSSADTHHSANAMVIGPDGWLYWSRGIFNVANFETPTKTFRSGQSGVHRFNPRTFEFEFHFPIGPNPHGDVFDRWGYQFANDGTSGTGSYVNIGKGVGNKQWFKKRVRPVAATGLLSSAHFPDENEGNFLVCNCIGFLGVLQHEVKYNGSDISATEIEPILVSTDSNFRPSDVEIGGDGALYVSDWHNTLIGHMQHNMRDPNRDHEHGRIYRVTARGRELTNPAKLRGKPIPEVCEQFLAKANSDRYRARLELTGRSAEKIRSQVQAFADSLSPKSVSPDRDEAQALLECLWVFEEQRIVNLPIVKRLMEAEEPRVRAAAIRTLGHWAGRVDHWRETLLAASRDDSPLVRAEAVKAAVEFADPLSVEIIFEVATRQTDPELDTVLAWAKRSIDVDAVAKQLIAAGTKLSPAAYAYVLKNATIGELRNLDKNEAVYRAILGRADASELDLQESLTGLAKVVGNSQLDVLMQLIAEARKSQSGNLNGLAKLLIRQSPDQLEGVRDQIESIAITGETPELKRLGYAAWVAAAGPDDAFLAATENEERLRDFLDSVSVVNPKVRGQLFDKVLPLTAELPPNFDQQASVGAFSQPGIQVEYYFPSADNVAIETLDKLTPKATGVVPEIVMNVPQRKQSDRFALRFSGNLLIKASGIYKFFVASDDGSRIYIDDKLVVNNDGLHGMAEKSADLKLESGLHKLVVTYFDNGGGDGLRVAWAGPGFKKRSIPKEFLSVGGGETLHDVAIAALAQIPGHDQEKFNALAQLIAKGKHRPSAIAALRTIPESGQTKKLVAPLIDNLLGYLSEMPARFRTGPDATNAIELTRVLTKHLPANDTKRIEDRLQNLDVRVIAIGTVSHRMIYDKESIAVQAGKPVEFRFSNTDSMPHNFAIVMPGSLEEIGKMAEAIAEDPKAAEQHYIPKSDKVLLSSKLLQPGEKQSLSFDVPTTPGVYPYVCTYPGHWRRMYGTLYVVDQLEAYQADPEGYLAEANLEIKDDLLKMNTRLHPWKYEELADGLKMLTHGRSYDVGRELFKVASCAGCHKLDGQGNEFGPDLAKLDEKKGTADAILRSILEPSKDIEEKYQSSAFVLDDGKVVTGMVVKETDEEVHLIVNPLAKDRATVIDQEEIVARKKSDVSQMPLSLLDKLTREEIFDLVAYVYAKGDKKHEMYQPHHHGHDHGGN